MTDGWTVTIAYERPPTRAVLQFTEYIEGREMLEAVAQCAADLGMQERHRIRVLSIGVARRFEEEKTDGPASTILPGTLRYPDDVDLEKMP